MAARHERMQRDQRKRMAEIVKTTLVEILRRGSIVDTDHPDEIDAAMIEQEKIATRIAKTLK